MSSAPSSQDAKSFPRGTRVAIVVAHPDDETLWAGGLILEHSDWDWTIVALCRRSDPDRAPKFQRVIAYYRAHGAIGDMDDGPDQTPLAHEEVEREVLSILPPSRYDIILTHGPRGEYTRHVRHEETSRAVSRLWKNTRITASELWMFAYEDGGGEYLPLAIARADVTMTLPSAIFKEKYRIITAMYGFSPDSWEARTTPPVEAFRRFRNPSELDPSHIDPSDVREGRDE
jgi:LmbE family N-acetylglucosaminyl deacetylase